jgi:predicted enzyme related to lactoylglutathione lyase
VKSIYAVLAVVMLFVAACATTNINVPAIEGVGESTDLPGKIVWHELLTDTPRETRRFYTDLFGWQFEALPDKRVNYQLIRHEGKLIGGMIDQTLLPTQADISQWVALFAVTDITLATDKVKESGGTVFTPPTSLGDRGDIAVVADPQGALFALLQSRGGEPADVEGTPAAGDFLWNELWTGQTDSAADFYRSIAPYQQETRTFSAGDNPVIYQILSSNGRARAGIRDNPFAGAPPMWVNFLRVTDTVELDKILAKVEGLGGEILVPAVPRPGGGSVALISGPSGAGIALQTWADGQIIGENEGAK